MTARATLSATAILAGLLLGLPTANSQPAADFYHDKQVRLVIGWSPGGDYDLGARLVAKYWSRHIPGHPSIVPQNMPGAISINAANYLFNVAPKDGTVIGTFSRNLPAQSVLGLANVRFDSRRFGWIGGAGLPSHVCVALSSSPIKSADDLFTRELLVAGVGAGTSPSVIPQMLTTLFGMKFKVVQGYGSSADMVLALKREEVSGLCHSWGFFKNLYADLLEHHTVRVLLHTEESPLAEMPDVPSVFAFAKTDAQTQLLRFLTASAEFGRPFVLPPDVPEERLAILRKGLAEALADPELLAEADRLQLDVTYRPGTMLRRLVEDIYATPKPLLDQAASLMPSD